MVSRETQGKDWQPGLYATYSGERLQPGVDLLSAVTGWLERVPEEIVDLGCGDGNLTAFIRKGYPAARITGIDASPAMLSRAKEHCPDVLFVKADAADWVPASETGLIYSNAVLHWLPQHPDLLVRWLRGLRAGALVAVQMPNNFNEPSHEIARTLAKSTEWRTRLDGVTTPEVLAMESYHDLLSSAGAAVRLWETTYLHRLSGEDAVARWMAATGLRPYLARLDEHSAGAFMRQYVNKSEKAYPRDDQGYTLFRFRRLFLLARKM